MTLDTRFFALDPADPQELFRFGQELMQHFDDRNRPPEQQISSDEVETVWLGKGKGWAEDSNGGRRLANQLGQGLPAIWEIKYNPGRMYRTPEESAVHDEDCEEGCTGDGYAHRTPCWVECSLDTAYSGRSKGLSCSELHAALLTAFYHWFSARGVRMGWINEYTGDYYLGLDGLDTLTAAGFDAMAWFHTQVIPAIEGGALGFAIDPASSVIPKELPYR